MASRASLPHNLASSNLQSQSFHLESTTQAIDSNIPMPPQLSDAWDENDDWTGISSAKERRKRQNRIHQRTYRKRRCLKTVLAQKSDGKDHTVPAAPANDVLLVERHANDRRYQSQLFLAVLDRLPILLIVRCPDLHDNVKAFLQQAFTNWGLNLPVARDLPFVTRLTTFDALARNALALHIPLEYLETDDECSLFNLQGPDPPGEQLGIPIHLLPTEMQKSVKHHPWVDLFPFPGMRDNILRGIETGIYDEDQLCIALCCDLLDFDANTKAPLLVWGESWDAEGWEFSLEFFKKWGILLQDCPEVLQSTNYWRRKRGERLIEL